MRLNRDGLVDAREDKRQRRERKRERGECTLPMTESNSNIPFSMWGSCITGWTYNPEDGRGRKNPITQKQAMEELAEVVASCRADNFTPTIVEKTDDYLHAEFESPTFGFIDDFEAYFPADKPNTVEYRSASRIGESDGNINRKRIKALRLELQKKGWASLGY